MAALERRAMAVWNGGLRTGKGQITSNTGVLREVPYSFATRFENEPGTNPEELIAAAHAACYSMAFAGTLESHGYAPQSVETRATCTVASQPGGGFKITKVRLETRGIVPGISREAFAQMAREGEKGCPVSNALREGVEIELDARLA